MEMIWNGLLTWLGNGLWDMPWWGLVLYTLLTTHITIASVTLFLHRAQAHRALDLHPAVSHFFRFWLWIGTGMVTKEWVAIHRKHHAKCETAEDPHSPQTRGIQTVLLKGSELYKAEAKNQDTLQRYGHNTPDDWVERNVYSRFSWHGVALMLIVNLVLFGAVGATIWAVQMLWIPVNAAGIINGIGHYWGYRNFASKDTSTNISPWGILIGGEELHNNHHTYPTSAKFSVKPYEFDLGWLYINMLSNLGLATPKKTPPKVSIGVVRPAVDAATVNAVITHRYDVMARFTSELKAACKAEIALQRENLANAAALRRSRRFYKLDSDMLCDQGRQSLREVSELSPTIAKILAMREELRQLWERTNANAEQLLDELKDWCKRAEDSGIASLQSMAVRVRSYA